MLGRMQEWPLLMHKIIDFAAVQFPNQEVASRTVEGPMHRTTYAEIRERTLKVAKRLERDRIKLGDRVATLAWNGYRHLEAWYGITGLGAVDQHGKEFRKLIAIARREVKILGDCHEVLDDNATLNGALVQAPAQLALGFAFLRIHGDVTDELEFAGRGVDDFEDGIRRG